MKKTTILLLIFIFFWNFSQGQDDTTATESAKKWQLNGYTKDLRTAFLDSANNVLLFNNQIHNRVNFSWFLNENWTFKADLRTQIFYGTLINTANPFQSFSEGINNANDDVLDLSWLVAGKPTFTMRTMFDRLYLDYTHDKWQVRLGRQRINWGINTVWNPHDIFNTFSYFDFDYEERPGSDALRVTYYTDYASSVEVAVKAFRNVDEIVAGGLWKFNKWNYDFQVLGGVYHKDVVLGAGWAGNIGNVGFKGEASYFQAYDTAAAAFAGTLAFDYSFSKGTYVNFGLLYNSLGTVGSATDNLVTFNLTAKNLFPYQWTTFAMVSHPLNPRLNGSLALIYSPSEDNTLFLNPVLTFSIKDNWDMDFIGQLVASKAGGNYGLFTRLLFVRLKWSF